MAKKTRKFTIILEPEPEGGYSVHCPALPGCISQGEDRGDALRNIEEAISEVWAAIRNGGTQEAFAVLFDEPRPGEESPKVIADEILQVLQTRLEEGLPLTIETVQVEVSAEVSV